MHIRCRWVHDISHPCQVDVYKWSEGVESLGTHPVTGYIKIVYSLNYRREVSHVDIGLEPHLNFNCFSNEFIIHFSYVFGSELSDVVFSLRRSRNHSTCTSCSYSRFNYYIGKKCEIWKMKIIMTFNFVFLSTQSAISDDWSQLIVEIETFNCFRNLINFFHMVCNVHKMMTSEHCEKNFNLQLLSSFYTIFSSFRRTGHQNWIINQTLYTQASQYSQLCMKISHQTFRINLEFTAIIRMLWDLNSEFPRIGNRFRWGLEKKRELIEN